jgi:hypothetical protein
MLGHVQAFDIVFVIFSLIQALSTPLSLISLPVASHHLRPCVTL